MKLKVSKGWLIFSAIVMAIALVVYFFGFENFLLWIFGVWAVIFLFAELTSNGEPLLNLLRLFVFIVFIVGMVALFSPT